MSLATLDYDEALIRLTNIEDLLNQPQRLDATDDDWFEYDPGDFVDKLRAGRVDNPRWLDLKLAADDLAEETGLRILCIEFRPNTFYPHHFIPGIVIPVDLYFPDGHMEHVGFKDRKFLNRHESRGIRMHVSRWKKHLASGNEIRCQLTGKHRLMFDYLHARLGQRVQMRDLVEACWTADKHPTRARVKSAIHELRAAIAPVFVISRICDARNKGGYVTMTES